MAIGDGSARRVHRLGGAVLALFAVLLVSPAAVLAQVADDTPLDEMSLVAVQLPQLRSAFAEALTAFVTAIPGTYGDEGLFLRRNLDAMDAALSRWDAAIRRYERLTASRAASADAHVALATVYLQRERLADALREMNAALAIDKTRTDALAVVALIHAETAQHAAAYQAWVRATVADPMNPAIVYHLAQQLVALGERDQAARALHTFTNLRLQRPARMVFFQLDRLSRLSASAPVFVPAVYSAGFSALRRGDYAAAMEAFAAAVAGDPIARTDPDADSVRRVGAALRVGKLQQALTLAATVTREHPASSEGHRVSGAAYAADEQYEAAVASLSRAMVLAPADERIRIALANALGGAGRREEAERVLLDAIAAIPGSGKAHFVLARLYQATGRHEEATPHLQAAAGDSLIAGAAAVYQAIGSLAFRQTNGVDAERAQRQRIDLNPNDASAHRALGELLLQDDRLDESLAEMLAALGIDQRDSGAWRGVAQVHLRASRHDAAVEAARSALDLDADDLGARYTLGASLLRLGLETAGMVELARFREQQAEALAREHHDSEVDALVHEAGVLLDERRYLEAVELLRGALARGLEAGAVQVSLGRALLALDETDEAIVALERASEASADLQRHRWLSEAYAAAGRTVDREREDAWVQRAKETRARRMEGSW